MTTAIQAIPQEQFKKWETAVQQFANDVFKKHPSLDSSFILHVVQEVKDLGLFREHISARALWGAFRNCVADGRIVLPPFEPVLDEATIEKIRAKFPPVVKFVPKELPRHVKSALAGVSKIPNNHARDVEENNSAIDKTYSDARNVSRLRSLKMEYRALKVNAETAMSDNPRSHGQNQAERKRLLAELNSNPKFAAVKD